MNSHTINRDQKNGPGRAGAAHWGQSPVHIPAHGERGVGSPGIDATTVETGGGLTAPVLFHSSLLSRPSSSGFEHRRQVLGFPPLARGPVATFNSCAALLIGRSHQLNRISDKPGSDLAYPFHLTSFHGVTFHIQEHATKGVGSAQDHIGEIQYAAYC